MTKREKQFYNFGAVCGLVKGITKQLMQDMENPITKQAQAFIACMGTAYPTDVKTEQEKKALLHGYERGKQLRKELAGAVV